MTPDSAPDRDLSLLGRELLAAVGAFRRRIRRVAPITDLPASQVELLHSVIEEPGLSVASLASAIHLAPNTASTLLRELTELGLLSRVADPSDRRVARFEVTPEGIDYVGRMRDRGGAAIAAALYELREEDREVLARSIPALRLLIDLLS